MLTLTFKLRKFAHEHDDIPAFHAAYIVCSLLAAALFSLGYFVVLVALHMCLDYVKYRDVHGYSMPTTFYAMMLESIGDIALLLLSLTFAVYLSHDFLLVAASGLIRSEMTLIRAAGTILPRIGIVEHVFGIVLNIHSYMHTVTPGLDHPMSRMQKWSAFLAVTCLGFLAYSVILYSGHSVDLLEILQHELSLKI